MKEHGGHEAATPASSHQNPARTTTIPDRLRLPALVAVAAPVALANLSEPLLGLVDASMIGRSPSPEPLAAVAMGGFVIGLLFVSFNFLRLNVTGGVARALGADRPDEAAATIQRGAAAAIVIGLALMAARPWVVEVVLAIYPAATGVERLAGDYLGVRILGAPMTLLNFVILGALIGAGFSGRALIHQAALNAVNAAADIYFVVERDMGVTGVAWGGVVAQTLALPLGLFLLKGRTGRLFDGDGLGSALRDRKAWRDFGVLNRDVFLRTAALLGAFLLFNRQSAALGAVAQAANHVVLTLVQSSSATLDGFAAAAEAEVGRAVGAKDRERFRIAVRRTTFLAALTAAGLSVLFAIGAGSLFDAITTNNSVAAAARAATPWLIAAPMAAVWAYQLDGVFIGAGRTRPMRDAMIVSAAAFAAVAIPAADRFGVHGLWAALMVLFLVRAATMAAAFPRLHRSVGA